MIGILAGNLNSGRSYHITTVHKSTKVGELGFLVGQKGMNCGIRL